MKALADVSLCSSLWVLHCDNCSQYYGPAVTITTNILYFINLWVEATTSIFTGPAVMAELNVTGTSPNLCFLSSFNIFVSTQFPILNLFLLKRPRAVSFSLFECSQIWFPIFSINNTNIYPLAKSKNLGGILDSLFFSLYLAINPGKSQPG